MDYHFYDEALFVALTHGIIERYNITILETETSILEISLQSPNPLVVYSAPSGNTLGDITIDWLTNTIYWIEFTELSILVRPCIHPSFYLSVHPSIHTYISIHQSIHSSIHPFSSSRAPSLLLSFIASTHRKITQSCVSC